MEKQLLRKLNVCNSENLCNVISFRLRPGVENIYL